MRANTPADDRAAAAPRRCERLYIDRLTHQLALLGGRACIRRDRKEIAAEEFLSSIYRYAGALTALGIQRGQIVALFAPNRPDALAIRYAANLIGAGAAFLSTPPTPEARSQLIADVDPALLVVFPETQKFVPVGIETPMATVGFPTAGAVRLDEIAAPQAGNSISCLAHPEDLAAVISSGGSTGVPKGSWRTFAAYTAMVTVPSPEDRRQLVNGPLAYLSQVLVDITLLGGGTVVLKDHYEAVDTLRTIETERITDLFLVEPQLFQLMDHPLVSKTDLSSLRTLTHIGASAPPVLRLRARQKLGPVIVHTYGASEEGLISVLTTAENDPSDPLRFSSAGCILPGVEIRFRRADGSIASPGEIGGIEVRSPAMAQGYRNRPDLEAVAFREGWYRSGDLGRIDEDGYLHIFGRAVDIAVIDAAMISPTRLEDTLCRMPRIRYASVVRDNESADRWIAAVVPWDNVTVDETACLEAIAVSNGQMVAERIHVTVQSGVPLTEQGKPDREAIRALGRLNLNQAATSIKR